MYMDRALDMLVTTIPPCRVNDDFALAYRQWKIVLNNQHNFANKNYRDDFVADPLTDECSTFVVQYLADSLIYVITETMMRYPWVYVTEKTWKAMMAPAPFMLLGTPNTLAWLKDRGFQTFSSWWDESYDGMPDAADRLEAVIKELLRLSKMDHNELASMRRDMEPVLKHNFANMQNLYSQELADIRNVLYNT